MNKQRIIHYWSGYLDALTDLKCNLTDQDILEFIDHLKQAAIYQILHALEREDEGERNNKEGD